MNDKHSNSTDSKHINNQNSHATPKLFSKNPPLSSNGDSSKSNKEASSDFREGQNTQAKSSVEYIRKRGVVGESALKYRKGACTNCGSLTHNAKNCVERPRKIGAKYTNQNICPDEHIEPKVDLGFEGNRDRWAGYDVSNHKYLAEEYEIIEMERRKRKMEKMQRKLERKKLDPDNYKSSDESDSSDDDIEGIKPKEFAPVDAMYSSFDSYTQTTSKNLRIREDTAKYLINLDVNSSFYDPKSRSMREDPLKGMRDENTKHTFRGDGVYLNTPETNQTKVMEAFAWEAYKRGANVHFMAKPTQLEYMYKQHLEKKKAMEDEKKNMLLSKYKCHNVVAPKELVELASGDNLIDAVTEKERILVRSKYEEDVYILGHTSVWGSYYNRDNGNWGYKCCKSEKMNLPCEN